MIGHKYYATATDNNSGLHREFPSDSIASSAVSLPMRQGKLRIGCHVDGSGINSLNIFGCATVGRNFNRMVQQLRENREDVEWLHRAQMSRAECLATVGELATGRAHEIRNLLAGIAWSDRNCWQ